MRIITALKKRYIDSKYYGGNGVLTRRTIYQGEVTDKDGTREAPWEDLSLRVRCLDCGSTLKIYASTHDDLVEIGGVMGSKAMWKEILKGILAE
jgi:hypothetical protein